MATKRTTPKAAGNKPQSEVDSQTASIETPEVDTPEAPQKDQPAKGEVPKDAPPPEEETTPPPSVFDQAVQFSMSGQGNGRAASDARKIWDALRCDDLPAPLAVAAFDCAIQQGEDIAQRLLGKLSKFDAEPLSEDLIEELVLEFLSWRLRRYAFTANSATNMQAWAKHVLRLQVFVLTDLKI